jgi:hypothetical protein
MQTENMLLELMSQEHVSLEEQFERKLAALGIGQAVPIKAPPEVVQSVNLYVVPEAQPGVASSRMEELARDLLS